ncbi:MAG: hypothetical protein ACREBU_15370 [Nitrososphaera sp.]
MNRLTNMEDLDIYPDSPSRSDRDIAVLTEDLEEICRNMLSFERQLKALGERINSLHDSVEILYYAIKCHVEEETTDEPK